MCYMLSTNDPQITFDCLSDMIEDNYKLRGLRNKLVKKLKEKGIQNEQVLAAIGKVPRHVFFENALLDHAYQDKAFPIGEGQTISQPFTVAFQTEKLELKPGDKVLEIGTGSGYQAADLAEIVKDVYTIEIIPELGNGAATRLEKSGYNNVHVKVSDGYFGWPEHGPYDAIVVTAAAEFVPPPLLEQLKDGGKIVIPIGSPFMNQNLMLIQKKGKKVTTRNLLPVAFVPFTRKKE